MSHLMKTTLAGVVLASMVPFGALASGSNTTAPTCTVKAVGSKNTANQSDSRFKVNGLNVTGTFNVTGASNCKVDVTLTTWQAPDGVHGLPYSAQKMYKHVTGTYGPGKYSLTTQMPNCFYQVDLITGSNPGNAQGGAVYEDGRMLGSLHGGTKACVIPTPTPTPTVTPHPTPTPTATPTPEIPSVEGASTQLPDTGAGLSTLLGLTAMAAAGLWYVRLRRRNRA
jgi:LPXTG-motif cell wall-anchored protein